MISLVFGLALVPTHRAEADKISTANCGPQHVDIHARVAQIYDGDTVQLADGRNVRLIGINTPERARADRPAEPLADAATHHLEKLVRTSPRLQLQLGQEKRDRYGRLLAHLFLADGRNLGRLMLEQGYGHAILVPPNSGFARCYRQAEQRARRAQLGIWQHAYFMPLSPRQVAARNISGFHRVQGRVVRVGESRKNIWLNLSDTFALRIARTDLDQFEGISLHSLQGKQLIARGWIRPYRGRWQIQIRHPAALEISSGQQK